MKSPKIISGVVKGVADLGKNVVYEAGKQAAKVVEEGAEELIGAQSSQPTSSTGTTPVSKKTMVTGPGKKKIESEEIEKLRQELRQSAGKPKGRDIEKEIKEVRRKKKKEEEEREFLEQLRKQREQEEEEAKRDAQVLEGVILPGTGERPKRGALFAVHRKQRKAELGRGAKN